MEGLDIPLINKELCLVAILLWQKRKIPAQLA
jgi:hypothetical protein